MNKKLLAALDTLFAIGFLAGIFFLFVWFFYASFSEFGNGKEADDDAYWIPYRIMWIGGVSLCGLGCISAGLSSCLKPPEDKVTPEVENANSNPQGVVATTQFKTIKF